MFVKVDGVGAINVARGGPRGKAPLVLLHPVGLDLTWWEHQFEAFSGERDVIAFDMPGHGLSDDLATAPTFELMAHTLESVLQGMGTGPVHLIGWSVGGMIAQTFALKRPELVSSLSLVGTLCTFPEQVRALLRERSRVARSEGMARVAQLANERWFPAAFRARRPDVLDRATRSLLQQPAGFHAAMWEMIAGLDLEKKLGAITCRALVLTGAEDVNAPPAAAEAIVRALPSASLKLMPGVGHFPPLEAPADFTALLRGFLAGA